MKAPVRAIALMIGALLVFTMAAYGSITVSQVDGLDADGKIEDGATLTFHMNLQNPYANPIGAIDNGFWFKSDGMTWDALNGAWNDAYCWSALQLPACPSPYIFDMGHFMKINGDTIGFGGINFMMGTGLPIGFNDVAYTIDLGPITLGEGTVLTMDSCKYDVNEWCWSISMVGEVECAWGGPYTWEKAEGGGPVEVTTTLSQDPIYLKDLESRILLVFVHNEDAAAVDLSTVRVHGKIPPYSPGMPYVDETTGDIVTDVFIFRFLSAYRPISSTVNDKYTVTYMKGTELVTVEGDVEIYVPGGDVNLDGKTDINDMVFMVDYFYRGGPNCMLEELMDIDGNGTVNVGDVSALARMIL